MIVALEIDTLHELNQLLRDFPTCRVLRIDSDVPIAPNQEAPPSADFRLRMVVQVQPLVEGAAELLQSLEKVGLIRIIGETAPAAPDGNTISGESPG